jgi:hypothetical protein
VTDIRLVAASSREGRAVIVLIGGQGFEGAHKNGDHLRCGACGELLASNLAENDLMNLILVCPACGSDNDVPDGPPQSTTEVHLLPGTYSFSDAVFVQRSDVRFRGIGPPEP